ncbi:MAG: hypothetical protein ACK5L5_04745 [Bacteroidales bacterium]
MKISALAIVLLITSITHGYSQNVSLEIKELVVGHITVNSNDDCFDSDDSDGPYISLSCELINMNNSDFSIFPSRSDIEITFNYEGAEYRGNPMWILPFLDEKEEVVSIKVGETIDFMISTYLLLGTPLWSERKSDYTDILLQILPTIRVNYKCANIDCYSTRIRNVVLLD